MADTAYDTLHDLDLEYVATLAEPCDDFGPADLGSPVCRGCGWLDHEHAPASSAVPEPRRPRVRRAGARSALAAAS